MILVLLFCCFSVLFGTNGSTHKLGHGLVWVITTNNELHWMVQDIGQSCAIIRAWDIDVQLVCNVYFQYSN